MRIYKNDQYILFMIRFWKLFPCSSDKVQKHEQGNSYLRFGLLHLESSIESKVFNEFTSRVSQVLELRFKLGSMNDRFLWEHSEA